MNKDELKEKAENLKGRVKEAFGALTGNKERRPKGFIDRMRGAVREKIGQGRARRLRDVSPTKTTTSDAVSGWGYFRTQNASGPQRPDGRAVDRRRAALGGRRR